MCVASYILIYLMLFNAYPYYASKPLSPTYIVSDPLAVRLLALALTAWSFVYTIYLFVLTSSFLGSTMRGSAASVGLCISMLVLALVALVTVPMIFVPERMLVDYYGLLNALHLPLVDYVLNNLVVPVAVALAALRSSLDPGDWSRLLTFGFERVLAIAVIAIVLHTVVEPLTNIAVTGALLALGGIRAALPYYLWLSSSTLSMLQRGLEEYGSIHTISWCVVPESSLSARVAVLMPPPWGVVVGSIVFALVLATSIDAICVEYARTMYSRLLGAQALGEEVRRG